MLYAKFPNEVDDTFLQDVVATFKNKLESPKDVEVLCAIKKGFVYFGVRSMESVTFDTMENTFNTFMDQLIESKVQYVGYVHSYSDTVNDVETFDDPIFVEYESIENEAELKELLLETNKVSMAYACVAALKSGRIDETFVEEADNWVQRFLEFEEDLYIENEYSIQLKKLQEEYYKIYESIEKTLLEGFVTGVAELADELFAANEDLVAEIFAEIWNEHGEALEKFVDQLGDITEKAENADTISSRKEDLLHYFESAGFADFQKRLDEMSDDEIEDLYDETFNYC